MVINVNKQICLIGALLILASCSSLKKQKAESFPQVKGEEKIAKTVSEVDSKQSLENAKKHLTSLVKQAQETGPEAIEYLSNDFFIKATDVSLLGDSYTASILFEALTKLNPNDDYLKRRLAVELIRIGKLAESKDIVSGLYERSKFKDETMGLILAGIHTALNDTKSAKQVYQKILKQSPANTEACLFIAKIYTAEKKYKSAKTRLNKCRALAPKKDKNIFAYYLGKLAYDKGNKKLAIKYFSNILKREPSYAQAALALGLIQEEMKSYAKAIITYKNFVKQNPSSFQVLNRLVQLMFSEDMGDEIIPYAQKLSFLDPEDLNLKVRLGTLYYDSGNWEQATKVFQEIIKVVPDSDRVLYYLGSCYQQLNDVESSIQYYSRIGASSPLFPEGYYQVGQMLSLMAVQEFEGLSENGDDADSRRFFKFVKQNFGKNPDLDVKLKVAMANYYEAIDQSSKAIEQLVEVETSKHFYINYKFYLASLHEKTKDFKASYKIIEDILKEDPNNAHALNYMGYSYIERGIKMDQAYTYIKKAIKLSPDDGYIRDSLGWFYFKKGNYKRALKEIKIAWKQVKSDVEIAKHLGMVYQELKMYNKAKKYFIEALKNCEIESQKKEVVEAMKKLEEVRAPASK